MAMIKELHVTLQDFMPEVTPILTVVAADGLAYAVGYRLYRALKDHAARNRIPLGVSVQMLRDELHMR